ncbi:hypothetical protein HG531_007872 [Fusarium graminearum]|nr:hypothetical protein HG531_007872 [Fusarium graminearum]
MLVFSVTLGDLAADVLVLVLFLGLLLLVVLDSVTDSLFVLVLSMALGNLAADILVLFFLLGLNVDLVVFSLVVLDPVADSLLMLVLAVTLGDLAANILVLLLLLGLLLRLLDLGSLRSLGLLGDNDSHTLVRVCLGTLVLVIGLLRSILGGLGHLALALVALAVPAAGLGPVITTLVARLTITPVTIAPGLDLGLMDLGVVVTMLGNIGLGLALPGEAVGLGKTVDNGHNGQDVALHDEYQYEELCLNYVASQKKLERKS